MHIDKIILICKVPNKMIVMLNNNQAKKLNNK